MKKLSLSVVMPNFNHGHLIEGAINAVISQSRPADEFIIIDDGSMDDSAGVIEKIINREKKQYGRIRFARHRENLGTVFSINEGLKKANGDFICFASADDRILPGFFAQTMEMAQQYPEVGIVFGRFVAIDPQGKFLAQAQVDQWQERRHVTPLEFLEEYIDKAPPDHSLCGATIWQRKALIDVGGFRPELESWCDTFAARAMALKYGSCYIPENFMQWTVFPDGYSSLTASRPKRQLNIVAQAARLMRSAQFAPYFPEWHVKTWQDKYRRHIIETHVKRLEKTFAQQIDLLDASHIKDLFLGEALFKLFETWVGFNKPIWTYFIRQALRQL